ncbi:MAG: hypothetical protein QM296_07915 [Bacillota bacterium]|nr:hypothetical protein [Bacillota bacterium]
MKAEKKVIASMPKCYAIAMLESDGERSFLVATEKAGDCQRFTLDGDYIETIWSEPGGVMTMKQLPGSSGAFLATHKFFSPNDSKEACLVIAEPVGEDGTPVASLQEEHSWSIRSLTPLPFVHRFDILTVAEKHYLIACCLKSDHGYRDDWTHPGRIYVAELPEDLSAYGEENPLPLTVLKEGLTKNHGYGPCVMPDGRPGSLVAAEEGVFRVGPPAAAGGEWTLELLTDQATSDCVEMDFDGDGVMELLTLSPFHGETLRILKPVNGVYETVYEHPEALDFLHAIWSGDIYGVPTALVGYRRGAMELLAISYSSETENYEVQVLDRGRGPTNVAVYEHEGVASIIAANRETDEVALYRLTP